MLPRTWFRTSSHLLGLFLVIAVLPSALLLALGWRLLAQDRALQHRQIAERRDQAGDLVVAALDQQLLAVEASLMDAGAVRTLATTPDSLVVVFDSDGIHAFPPQRLAYYPQSASHPEAPADAFREGEAFEVQRADARRAAAWFRDRARSTDAAVRAGALIRLARNLRKTGNFDHALAAYDEAAAIDGAAVAGRPADLLARWAQCELLASLKQEDVLRRRAAALHEDLHRGRWQLDRATYEMHVADVSTWLGHPQRPSDDVGTALAEGVAWLWSTWQSQQPSSQAGGRTQLVFHDLPVTVLWRVNQSRFAAIVAGPDFAQQHWLAKVASTFEHQRVQIDLGDGAMAAVASDATRRTPNQTGLPWMVAVNDLDVADPAGLTTAQMLWLGALGVLVCLVVTATAIIGRAMARELAVARLQNDFVAAVSHEFRTPLTSMRQLTEMLLDRPATSLERQRTYYDALARQTERLHRLVESLLDFGRMEAGRSPYRRQPLEAGALIAAIAEQFRSEAASRGYRLDMTSGGTPATIIAADPDAITNALWNLLENAVKYSPTCRTIWLETGREHSMFVIHVRDRGVGITRAEQDTIFDKFVRGEHAKAEKIAGTGIGLAMVKHIVRAHDGRVSVESAPGQGSTFTIRLPIAAPCPES